METRNEPPAETLQLSEQPIMLDGQLGGELLESQGPERTNPEGSIDISNEDLQE